jgi:hypothetical protein
MQIRFCEICTNFETASRSYLCLEKQGEIRLHHEKTQIKFGFLRDLHKL